MNSASRRPSTTCWSPGACWLLARGAPPGPCSISPPAVVEVDRPTAGCRRTDLGGLSPPTLRRVLLAGLGCARGWPAAGGRGRPRRRPAASPTRTAASRAATLPVPARPLGAAHARRGSESWSSPATASGTSPRPTAPRRRPATSRGSSTRPHRANRARHRPRPRPDPARPAPVAPAARATHAGTRPRAERPMTRTMTAPRIDPPGALMASVQGTLALDYGTHGPRRPAPDLRLVAGGRAELEAFAHRFASAVVEVVGGDRGPSQLLRWTSERVYAELQRRAALLARTTPGTARPRGCAARCAACTCSARRPRPPRSACTCATASAPAPSRPASSWSTAAGAAPPWSSADPLRPAHLDELGTRAGRARPGSAGRAGLQAGRAARRAVALLVLLARAARAQRVAARRRRTGRRRCVTVWPLTSTSPSSLGAE